MTTRPTAGQPLPHYDEADPGCDGFTVDQVGQSIPARFAQVVSGFPKKSAIETDTYTWNYEELDAISDSVATAIAQRKSSTNPVALRMGHDAPLIASMFGALKSDLPYVVINPNDPAARQASLLKESRSQLLITDGPNVASQKVDGIEQLSFEQASTTTVKRDWSDPGPDDICSIVYTSGSTGAPKAVQHTHRNVLHQVLRQVDAVRISPSERFVLVTPINYAAAMSPVFGSLLTGGTLLPFDMMRADVASLGTWLADRRITIFHCVPTVFRTLCRNLDADVPLSSLRLVRLGGDIALSSDLQLYKDGPFTDACRLMVSYGSTETGLMLYSLFDRHSDEKELVLPLVHAATDMDMRLLDEDGNDVPVGESGRITITSAYLSPDAGEVFREDLGTVDAERSDGASWVRRYQVGDLARKADDRRIYFVGRADRQVKIHGNRVELDEVEAVLLALPVVSNAAVIVQQSPSRPPALVAYVVRSATTQALEINLQIELRKQLPPHMIPSVIRELECLPTLPSGKINRQALASPGGGNEFQAKGGSDGADAPVSELEVRLTEIWRRGLGVTQLDVNDNFFEMGGHSLVATELMDQIKKEFGKELPLAILFEAPTVRRFAQVLQSGEIGSAYDPLVAIQSQGQRSPLFCFHGGGGDVLCFEPMSRRLGNSQPVYGLRSPVLDPNYSQSPGIEQLAQQYLLSMQIVEPQGPYYLIGACNMGSLIALETAYRLEQQGRQVAMLAMVDPNLVSLVPRSQQRFRRLNKWRRRFSRWAQGKHREYGERRKVNVHHRRAIKQYKPVTVRNPITLFVTRERQRDYQRYQDHWSALSQQGVEAIVIDAGHQELEILRVAKFADVLGGRLERS